MPQESRNILDPIILISLQKLFGKKHRSIMDRFRVHNKFLRDKTKVSKISYNKQRNICVSLENYESFIFRKVLLKRIYFRYQ